MVDFGDTDPLWDHNDDEDEGNTTIPFKPDYNSTSGPTDQDIPMTTKNIGREKLSETAETSFVEGDTSFSRVITSHEMTWDSLPEFILRQRLRNSNFLIVKQEGCR